MGRMEKISSKHPGFQIPTVNPEALERFKRGKMINVDFPGHFEDQVEEHVKSWFAWITTHNIGGSEVEQSSL